MDNNITYKFEKFDEIEKKILDEEETLKHLSFFYQGVPKDKRKALYKDIDTLAKYAFENHTTYYLTFYKQDKPFVSVNSGDGIFDLSFLSSNEEGNIVRFLKMNFVRIDMQKLFKEGIYELLPNHQSFLNQIVIFSKNETESIRKELEFIPKNKKNTEDKLIVIELRHSEKDGSRKKTVEETTEIDLSKNYFKAPQHFYDYEHLFDYESILNQIRK
ncbi:hypothetical protein [Neisseria montereyensis]|uniref:Uncharacterized protein n=1 Tax=Neisseria montereyensis TaxID=2973938 RepID=A0ABT2FCK6_9NEIS|nr:hypothetical protein [Neisseria montereyensis]MCS4533830.1 hypothetical protein [Neisseria montereyensis]